MENRKIKESYQKELRHLWFRKNLKPSLTGLLYFGLVAAIPILFSLSYIVDSTEDALVTVTGMAALESEESNRVYMMATLEDGTAVRVYVPAYLRIEKGRKAVLIAKKGRFFGGVRYSFKKYVDD